MSLHVETHMVDIGGHVAEVLHTKTRKVLHRTEHEPSQAAARQVALEWIDRLALMGLAHANSAYCRRCRHRRQIRT